MKLSFLVGALVISEIASAITVSHDPGYDDRSRSLNLVSCSDGQNGLITKHGWQTQGAVPRFPNIGGSQFVTGWNSTNCGKCFRLTYQNTPVFVLAIDHAAVGFNIAVAAMNTLTKGQAIKLGRVEADYAEVDVKNCGLRGEGNNS